jgi:leucyl aminopeptidase (aminopeptidase T)
MSHETKNIETCRERLRNQPFDPELSLGASNAVNTCLKIQDAEKTTLITDETTIEIAASIAHELEQRGLTYNPFVLESYAPRPLVGMPQPILDDMESSQISIFAVKVQTHELNSRKQMTDVVNRRRMRHAHMVNIEKVIMLQGMRADYDAVDALSKRVIDIAAKAKFIRATTPAGTELVAEMTPKYKWLKTSGIISPEKWGNLPGGEIFTTPWEVNGTFVVDGVVGDYLCAKYGLLADCPLTIRVEKNRLVEAKSVNKELEQEFWHYCHTDENSDRVGEFAIGTNIGLTGVIGNILQDEKVPGIHIAFGSPYGAHTGADWDSVTHIDVVGLNFDIWADDTQIMAGGRFLV